MNMNSSSSAGISCPKRTSKALTQVETHTCDKMIYNQLADQLN
jgi:hypothetical protein